MSVLRLRSQVAHVGLMFCLIGVAPAAAPAQSPTPALELRLLTAPTGGGRLYRYTPGHWNTLRLLAANHTDDAADVLATTFVGEQSTLQFGRRLWLPPHAQLETWQPLLLPSTGISPQDTLEARTQLFRADRGQEALIRDEWGKLQAAHMLPTFKLSSVTGVIGPPGVVAATATPRYAEALEFLSDTRRNASLPPSFAELADAHLPPTTAGYDGLRILLVCHERLADDAEALAAVRRWLYGGGRLWVMLDQADPRVLERLLGDECDISAVDRVDLTTVALTYFGPNRSAVWSEEFERPVEFVRTTVGSARVVCSIDGWPAAFWKTCGEGKLLVTTLAARGWQPAVKTHQTQPSPPAEQFLSELYDGNTSAAKTAADLAPIVEQYIGYSVPSRQVIVWLLMGFAAALALLTAVLARRGRLEWLGWASPALALAVAALLVGVGWKQRGTIAAATAQIQLVDVLPSEEIQLRGVAALYAAEGSAGELSGAAGGWLLPDDEGLAATTRRLIWTDLGAWRWTGLEQQAGVRIGRIAAEPATTTSARAAATFDRNGVVGRWTLPDGVTPEDAVLATRGGRLGVTAESSGGWRAGLGSVLGAEQFLAAELLSDEQRRRADVLERLLQDRSRSGFPSRPTLLFWSTPRAGVVQTGAEAKSLGAALWMVPVALERPAVGTEAVIPPPLLSYREAFGPDGTAPTGFLNNRTLVWQERAGAATAWLRVQLPPELQPLDLRSVSARVRVAGPVGQLELAGWRDGQRRVLKSWSAPVGTLSADLTDVDALAVSPGGTFLLQVSAGVRRPDAENIKSAEELAKPQYWRIESLDLTVRAALTADVPPAAVAPGIAVP